MRHSCSTGLVALGILAACTAPSPPRIDGRLTGIERESPTPAPTRSFIPSHDETKRRRERELGNALAQTIEKFTGADDVDVHLSLADRSLLSANPAIETSCAILINSGAQQPDQAAIKELAVAAIPGLAPARVKLFFSTRTPTVLETQFVGPIEVAQPSVMVAKIALGGLLSACLILAAGLIYAGLRLRRMRRGSTTAPPRR